MNRKLLDILCCPATHRPLRMASAELLKRVNACVDAGELHHHSGEPVSEALREALVTDDDRVLYPVDDGIPVLLEDEAIALAQLG